MRIRDVMSRPAVTCPTDAALDAAARLMWEFDCGFVLVVHDDGRLAGVVTDRDICLAAYTHRKPLHLIPLARAMAKPVISVHAACGACRRPDRCRDRSRRRPTGHRHARRARSRSRLPVIDDGGHPVGVISVDDLLQLAARAKRTLADQEFVGTIAAVMAPRSKEPGTPHPLVPTGPAGH
jgi:CBS domain-containing protein